MRTARLAFASAITAAGLWGLSGTAAQALFDFFGFPVLGLVALRGLVAGLLLVAVLRNEPRPAFTANFLAVSILGIAGSQVTYLAAIQYSNAVTATLLQYLFLPIVAAYEALHGQIQWSRAWSATLALAGVGTLLLVANPVAGSIGVLVTPAGLLFGLLAAVSAAYYSLAGKSLAERYGSWSVTGWGFLVGGIVTLPFGAGSLLSYTPPHGVEDRLAVIGLVGFVILFGTLLAYGLYLFGLRHLPATEVGVAAAGEPIGAAAATYGFLGVTLSTLQYVGGALIVVAVALLGFRRGRDGREPPDDPASAPSKPLS